MELHPESQKIVDYLKANVTDNSKLTIEQIRKNAAARTKVFSGSDDYPFDGVRMEEVVPSLHVKGWINFCLSISKYRLSGY